MALCRALLLLPIWHVEMTRSLVVTPHTYALLHTKLHRPHALASTVARPRLWETLEHGLDGPILLVCAPAGYGKTTLVSSWLAHRSSRAEGQMPSAWLSLDERDGELDVFLRYLCAALEAIFPGACSHSLSLLRSAVNPPLDEFVTSLSNEIAALPHEFILVLDDVHNVSDSVVPRLLAALTPHWPQPMHLVLIGRRPPALPLASLRAKGMVTEVNARDLRFTTDEVDQYLRRVARIAPSESLVIELEGRTEGWAAGLRLASMAIQNQGTKTRIPELMDASASATAYLLDDVLAHEPAAIQEFLIRIAFLDHWCLPLAIAVAPETDEQTAKACLDWLERSGFFIVALDQRHQWFRFHRLLRDALQQRATATLSSDEIAASHRRAAHWFEAHGLIDEAQKHALATHDLDHAARIVETGLNVALNREERQTLDRWLRPFPEAFLHQRPGLLIAKAAALQFAWRLGEMGMLLPKIETLLSSNITPPSSLSPAVIRGMWLVMRAQLSYFQGEMSQCYASSEESLALVPDDWTFVRGSAFIYLAMAGQALGRADYVDQQIADAYQALDDHDNTYALRLLFGLCMSAFQEGHLEQSQQLSAVMAEIAERSDLPLIEGWANYWRGNVAYERDELAAAATHYRDVVAQRFVVNTIAARLGLAGLVMTCAALNETDAAWDALNLSGQFDIHLQGVESTETRAARAWLSYLRGDHRAAFLWADEFTPASPLRVLIWPFDARLIKAKLLQARGRPEDLRLALVLLDELGEIATATHSTRWQIQAGVGRATVLWAMQQTEPALTVLQTALDLAQPGGFIRIFVEHGAVMQQMLRQLAGRMNDPSTAHRLLARLSGTDQPGLATRPAPPLDEPLTPRELDVLRLMRERKSDKEIASALGITVGTVKRHSANLFSKLGVNRRWEAVVRAEEYALL